MWRGEVLDFSALSAAVQSDAILPFFPTFDWGAVKEGKAWNHLYDLPSLAWGPPPARNKKIQFDIDIRQNLLFAKHCWKP